MIDQMNDQMLRAILETLPMEITIIDANDEVVGWNRHEDRLFNGHSVRWGSIFDSVIPQKSLAKVEQILRSTELEEEKRLLD